MLHREERILAIAWCLIGLILGAAAGVIAGWAFVVPVGLTSARMFPYIVLTTGAAGILTAAMTVRRMARTVYDWPAWIPGGLYILFAVGLIGLLMLVPLMNPLLGVPAGLYWGRRLVHRRVGVRNARQSMGHCAFFTGAVMAVLGAVSAQFAVGDLYTAGALRLLPGFRHATHGTVTVLVAVGLPIITLAQFWITLLSARFAWNRGGEPSPETP